MASPALLALARRVNTSIASEGRFMQLAEEHIAHILELGGGLLPVHLEAADETHDDLAAKADDAKAALDAVQTKLDQALSREGDLKAALDAAAKRVAVLSEAQNIAKQRIAELERASVDEKTEHSAEVVALTKRIDDLAAKVPAVPAGTEPVADAATPPADVPAQS